MDKEEEVLEDDIMEDNITEEGIIEKDNVEDQVEEMESDFSDEGQTIQDETEKE